MMAVGTAARNKSPSCFRMSMEDFGYQPAFGADEIPAFERKGKSTLYRPGYTQTKEKFIASALGSVNVAIFRVVGQFEF